LTSHDHEIASDCWRGGLLILSGTRDVGDAVLQIDLAAGTKVSAWTPVRRIDREQARVDRRHKNPFAAGGRIGAFRVRPERHAAIDQPFRIAPVQLDLRIERPFRLAGLGFDREHAAEWCAHKHRPGNDDRRRLEFALRPAVAAVGHVAGAQLPRGFQLVHVGLVDLIQRGVAASACIAAVEPPVRGDVRSPNQRGRGHRERHTQDQRAHRAASLIARAGYGMVLRQAEWLRRSTHRGMNGMITTTGHSTSRRRLDPGADVQPIAA
jgi:hypothetical protein